MSGHRGVRVFTNSTFSQVLVYIYLNIRQMEIAVTKEVLLWAIERSGKSPDQLLPDFPKLSEWLAGRGGPSMAKLRDLAKKLHVPLGFLFLQQPPKVELPVRMFRTRTDDAVRNPSPELIDTLFSMQRRQLWLREYLESNGSKPLPYVGKSRLGEEPKTVAGRMRSILKLDSDWSSRCSSKEEAIKHFRHAIEEAGAFVFLNGVVGNNTHRTLDSSEFLGFVLCDEFAPLIFLNSSDVKSAQMFTLAHEFAHLLFGLSAAFDLSGLEPSNDPGEKACNAVAAEFLVPAGVLAGYLSQIQNLSFQAAARRLKVSEIVIARRALDLGAISRTQFFTFYNQYVKQERQSSENSSGGGDFFATQNSRVGKHFASVVKAAISEKKLLYSEGHQLTGLKGKAFDRYILE